MMLRLILLALVLSWATQSESGSSELPAWTSAPAEPNLFVVETEEYSTHGDAAKSLLPAVKKAVTDWAEKNVTGDCRSVLDAMPLDEFQQFIHDNQEVIHDERRKIVNEYDVFYRGYVRVEIDKQFFKNMESSLRTVRLERRLGGILLATLFVLGSLSVLWCWLFMRIKSRGLYIKRIRWITAAMTTTLLLVCYLVFRMLF
jgi:hypothetical protein